MVESHNHAVYQAAKAEKMKAAESKSSKEGREDPRPCAAVNAEVTGHCVTQN